VVLEATREWVRFYPGTDHFQRQVEQSHEDHQSAVRRALSAAGLTEEGSARLADISSAGDPPRR
jgi:hypothetical protein